MSRPFPAVDGLDWISNVGFAILGISYLMRNILILRITLAIGCLVLWLWGLLVLDPWESTFAWNLLFMLINLFHVIYILVLKRLPLVRLSGEELELYRNVFKPRFNISKKQFCKLVSSAKWRDVAPGTVLVREGENIGSVGIVVSGAVQVGRRAPLTASTTTTKMASTGAEATPATTFDAQETPQGEENNNNNNNNCNCNYDVNDDDMVYFAEVRRFEFVGSIQFIEQTNVSTVEYRAAPEFDNNNESVRILEWDIPKLHKLLKREPLLANCMTTVLLGDMAVKVSRMDTNFISAFKAMSCAVSHGNTVVYNHGDDHADVSNGGYINQFASMFLQRFQQQSLQHQKQRSYISSSSSIELTELQHLNPQQEQQQQDNEKTLTTKLTKATPIDLDSNNETETAELHNKQQQQQELDDHGGDESSKQDSNNK